ncbi:MAG: SDR family NAD(P)-dependent oxidoreductase, partial [Burkholderiales bacterium]|nr:SDR family NAD(P)-dependent oxidoreductase [Burkholderiales bacterium]
MSHCLITGGTRGIGYATALVLAANGHDVSLVGRTYDPKRTESLKSDIAALGRVGAVFQGDMALEADVERVFRESEAALGSITGLVNSAGIGGKSRVDELEGHKIERLLSVNVLGLML